MPILFNLFKELEIGIGNWNKSNVNFSNLLKELEIEIGNWNKSNANFSKFIRVDWELKLEIGIFPISIFLTRFDNIEIRMGNWNISNANFLKTFARSRLPNSGCDPWTYTNIIDSFYQCTVKRLVSSQILKVQNRIIRSNNRWKISITLVRY